MGRAHHRPRRKYRLSAAAATARPPVPHNATVRADPTHVHRYYQLVDAGEIDELVALFAPNAVYRRPGYAPLVGREALRAFYEGERIIEHGRHEVDQTVLGEDAVAVHGRFEGRLKDGSAASLRFADFYTFDVDGLFATRDTFFFAPLV